MLVQDPYRLLAVKGSEELVQKGGERVLPVIPQLIMPLKAALKAGDQAVVTTALRMLQLLVGACPQAGQALLPYYRQLLPPLNRCSRCPNGAIGECRETQTA
jgi:hypothetical protein